mgnify:CR=1 FL=1
MIKSMTGYGRAKLSKDDREYQIEIKSVNHKYLDISVRIPKQLSYLEETIKSNWSVRQLERQINSFYYERLLSTSEEHKEEVKKEIDKKSRENGKNNTTAINELVDENVTNVTE